MSDSYDLIVRGGTCATPAGIVTADVATRDGRFAAIGDLSGATAAEAIDAAGLHVLPGVIDTQVHFREPGAEHKEDLAHGTAAAARGGVTGVFEMPNTKPNTVDNEQLRDKLDRARGRASCDYAFFLGANSENAQRLAEIEGEKGCCGIKIFMGSSTGTLLVADDEGVFETLRHGRRRIAVHCEDEPRLLERKHIAEEAADPSAHPVWRDEETALRATSRLLSLARRAGRRVHVLHVTTRQEMALLARNKDVATVEVTPQHLTLFAPDCYERLGTLAQMNPPIRDVRHRDALWRAVASGIVDVLGSDHAPHTLEEKGQPYPASPSGMPGVQTLLPIMLDHVNEGRLTLQRLVDLTSAGPARIYDIAAKGRLAVGYDADLALVDMKARRTITSTWADNKCGWTPFEGMAITGWPMATVLRGQVVMRDGELLGPPSGEPIRFLDSLAN